MQLHLDPVKRPYEDLVCAFSKQNHEENVREYGDSIKQLNCMRQRRVMVTPTLIRFSVAQEEQTNRVLRQFCNFVPNFIRLSFVTEELDKGFYFGGS
jgi:gamma-glutamyl:cysteine ligase YbdK (ATP-grasp superfamily)